MVKPLTRTSFVFQLILPFLTRFPICRAAGRPRLFPDVTGLVRDTGQPNVDKTDAHKANFTSSPRLFPLISRMCKCLIYRNLGVMKLFLSIFHRLFDQVKARITCSAAYSFFFGSQSGKNVNERTAMRHSRLCFCENFSETLASLPLQRIAIRKGKGKG